MNIYLVEQDVNDDYDTFDGFVCFAADEEKARQMLPDPRYAPSSNLEVWERRLNDVWTTDLPKIKVTLLGVAAQDCEARVILASFNAG